LIELPPLYSRVRILNVKSSLIRGTGVRPVEDREAYLVKREASEKEKECRLTIEKEEAKKAEKNLIERD